MKAKHLSVFYYLDPALRIVELAFHRQGPGNTLKHLVCGHSTDFKPGWQTHGRPSDEKIHLQSKSEVWNLTIQICDDFSNTG